MKLFVQLVVIILTALHLLVTFTPLYYWIVRDLLGSSPAVVESARAGFIFSLPWIWTVANRRFGQGVLIRFGYSKDVGRGNALRLTVTLICMGIGSALHLHPVALAAGALSVATFIEMLFVRYRVVTLCYQKLDTAPALEKPLTFHEIAQYYLPLAATSVIGVIAGPIGTAAMFRMHLPLESVAAWPVVSGIGFVFRSMGVAYTEVVVAHIEESEIIPALNRFTHLLALLGSGALILTALTPLATIWFEQIAAVPAELLPLCEMALLLYGLTPALNAYQSRYTGAIMYQRNTGRITEATVILVAVLSLCLFLGMQQSLLPGIYVFDIALTVAILAQNIWLRKHCRR